MLIGAEVHMGDIVFQFVSFLLIVGVLAGIGFLVVSFNKRKSRLNRVEEKVDQLLEKNKSQSER